MPKVKERFISCTVVNAENIYGQLTFVVSFICLQKFRVRILYRYVMKISDRQPKISYSLKISSTPSNTPMWRYHPSCPLKLSFCIAVHTSGVQSYFSPIDKFFWDRYNECTIILLKDVKFQHTI